MEMPGRNEVFENVATNIVESLDDSDFAPDEVVKIAEWIVYLATQD